MEYQNKLDKSLNWTTICKEATLWKEHPNSKSWDSFLLKGGVEPGYIEYEGNALRFIGKKSKVEIPAVARLSEVRVELKFAYFLLWFCFTVFFEAIILYLSHLIISWVRFDIIMATIILGLSLLFTVGYWLYIRKYGSWVCISYNTLDRQSKEVCFWVPITSGGSQKLYEDLSKLTSSES